MPHKKIPNRQNKRVVGRERKKEREKAKIKKKKGQRFAGCEDKGG